MGIYCKTYRIAINGAYAIKLIGPLMTLAQAQAYAQDMSLGGVDVMVVNTETRQFRDRLGHAQAGFSFGLYIHIFEYVDV